MSQCATWHCSAPRLSGSLYCETCNLNVGIIADLNTGTKPVLIAYRHGVNIAYVRQIKEIRMNFEQKQRAASVDRNPDSSQVRPDAPRVCSKCNGEGTILVENRATGEERAVRCDECDGEGLVD